MTLAANPIFGRISDRLLGFAEERAQDDADQNPWKPAKVAAFLNRYERPPATADDLFELVIGRLDDIKEESENGDFSLKGMFKENEKEEFFQKWLASRLEASSNGIFDVAREVEVFDKKMPDIRVYRSNVGLITLEIKVASKKYTYTKLRDDALTKQLVDQYMRTRRSRHGVLVLVNLKKNRKWQPEGLLQLDFNGLVCQLKNDSDDLARSRNRNEKITVFGIDLA